MHDHVDFVYLCGISPESENVVCGHKAEVRDARFVGDEEVENLPMRIDIRGLLRFVFRDEGA